jgi:hypothetical protein
MWIEELAAGVVLPAAHVSRALFNSFSEASCVLALNRGLADDHPDRVFTFRERCIASGCSDISAPHLDEGIPAPDVERPAPRALLDALRRPQVAGAPALGGARRPRAHLMREAGIRGLLASISRSWRATSSALLAYSSFMDAYEPLTPHFPFTVGAVVAFCSSFAQPRTFQRYLASLRFASRMMLLDDLADNRILHALVRGALAPLRSAPPRPIRRVCLRPIPILLRRAQQ